MAYGAGLLRASPRRRRRLVSKQLAAILLDVALLVAVEALARLATRSRLVAALDAAGLPPRLGIAAAAPAAVVGEEGLGLLRLGVRLHVEQLGQHLVQAQLLVARCEDGGDHRVLGRQPRQQG